MKTPVSRPIARPIVRPNAKPPARPLKPAQSRATYTKVAVVAASATFVTAKLVDIALIGSGIAAAAGSVAFAGFMLMQDEHAPRVNGMEYLAVFGAPKRIPYQWPDATDVAADSPGIDLTPTGAISVPATTARSDYVLVSARTDRAWVRAGSRIFAVHPGDVLPNLGKVAAVVWSDDRWMILGDDGQTLLASGDGIANANPKATFAKPLIMDGGGN